MTGLAPVRLPSFLRNGSTAITFPTQAVPVTAYSRWTEADMTNNERWRSDQDRDG